MGREINTTGSKANDVDIQKATIKAARDIGVAYGNGPKANVVQYNVYGWW